MASKEFSQRLKELRLNAGYSQKQVYEHFDIPQSTFSSWEVGKSEPSGEMLIKLCEFYNCDIMKEFSSEQNEMITYNELKIIEKYRALDSHGKEMVDFTLNKECERSLFIKAETEKNISPFYKKHLEINAAHERTDIEITEEMRQHDEDIMNDENF